VTLKRGFSVIEALAAVALLALALTPLYSMLQQINSAALRIQNLVEARDINGTVASLLHTGLAVPAQIQGWTVTVVSEDPSAPEAVDGYLGGQYFNMRTEEHTVTLQKNDYTFERHHITLKLIPVHESEEHAIFSNM